MVRSADPTRPDIERSSGPFSAQLALGRVHPALAPMRPTRDGYELDLSAAPNWFALPVQRGLAGYGLARALRILLDLLAGLTALHETRTADDAGFVHGELTPGHVRVDGQGIARLQPLARWHWQASGTSISPQSIGYLAPERILGDAIDRRADVYSAGVLLWEALAGKRLFERDSGDEIITRLMGGKVLLPELPPELAWAIPLKAVAMRALSVDPEQRFADCPGLAAAIEAVARRHVASHALVAAHFAEPARVHRSQPPPLPHRPSLEEAYRGSHKSSLSALVAPSFNEPASNEVSTALPSPRRGARPVAWALGALVALFVALVGAAFSRNARTYVVAHVAAPLERNAVATAPALAAALAPAAPVLAAAPTPATSVAPSKPAPSATPQRIVDAAVPLAVPARAPHPPRVEPPARETKGRAAPKVVKSAAPAKRVPASEAEQYGI